MQHPNTGGLWPNTYKQKSTDPDLQGLIHVGNKPVKIVAWYTDGKGGKPKLSIRVNTQQDIPHESTTNEHTVGATYDVPPEGADNDIPF